MHHIFHSSLLTREWITLQCGFSFYASRCHQSCCALCKEHLQEAYSQPDQWNTDWQQLLQKSSGIFLHECACRADELSLCRELKALFDAVCVAVNVASDGYVDSYSYFLCFWHCCIVYKYCNPERVIEYSLCGAKATHHGRPLSFRNIPKPQTVSLLLQQACDECLTDASVACKACCMFCTRLLQTRANLAILLTMMQLHNVLVSLHVALIAVAVLRRALNVALGAGVGTTLIQLVLLICLK